MRKSLDALYLGAAWLAALFMIGVLIMVLLSIFGRLLQFYVPGTDAYAGYAMAGAGFLALAHTLKSGEHIRVTLIIGKLTGGARRGLELWSLSVAVLLRGRRHATVDPADPHGRGHHGAADRLHRRMGARIPAQARPRPGGDAP